MIPVPKRVPDAEIEEDVTFGNEEEDPEYGLDDFKLDDSDDEDGDTVVDNNEDYFADL